MQCSTSCYLRSRCAVFCTEVEFRNLKGLHPSVRCVRTCVRACARVRDLFVSERMPMLAVCRLPRDRKYCHTSRPSLNAGNFEFPSCARVVAVAERAVQRHRADLICDDAVTGEAVQTIRHWTKLHRVSAVLNGVYVMHNCDSSSIRRRLA
jgi:hypothetical protein